MVGSSGSSTPGASEAPESWLKHRLWALLLSVYFSSSGARHGRKFISNEFPGIAHAAGLGDHTWRTTGVECE